MTDFHDIRLPLRLALGAQGGPERKTDIVTLASGREVRNTVWAQSRRRWDLAGATSNFADLQSLAAFFEARQGRLFGFRFRDPLDYSSAPAGGSISALDQHIAIGDGEMRSFMLQKAYGAQLRRITKPVGDTVRVALDDVETEIGWSVDTMTGCLEFETAPPAGVVVRAGFEFDCAVRFENDQFLATIEAFNAGRVVALGLIELVD